MSEKIYGKYIAWPPLPKFSQPLKTSIQTFSDSLKKVYAKWRARKMVLSLTVDQRAEMLQKVHALDIFRGKKPWE